MLPSSSRYLLVPELSDLLLPELDAAAADDDGLLVVAAEGDAVDDELALLSRVGFELWDLGFPMLAPVPALKGNIGGARSTSRLEEDGPPSSTDDDEEWLAAPGNASEWSDPVMEQ